MTVSTEAVFQCQHSSTELIVWMINGSSLGEFPNTVRIHHNGSISSLTITAYPQYKQIVVECVAVILGITILRETASATMRIQGKLHGVLNY